MGSPLCPNCKKGVLLSRKRYRKCNRCGYIKYKSPLGRSRGTILLSKENEKERKKIKISDSLSSGRNYPVLGEEFHSEIYQERKRRKDKQIRLQNKMKGIQKILAKLRKQKYNPVKEIMIEGELWNVKTGKPVKEEKAKKEKKEKFTPDRIIEEMVSKES